MSDQLEFNNFYVDTKKDIININELDFNVFLGDIKEIGKNIPDNSVDFIITDPPYPKEFLPLWDELSMLSHRVLKPSAFLVTYSGKLHLNEVMLKLNKNLIYYWTICLQHSGSTKIVFGRNTIASWKPILIFQKAPFKRIHPILNDMIKGGGREKDLHKWQQSSKEIETIINTFSNEGDTILDPFAGSGSFLIESYRRKRKVIGIDIDIKNMKNILQRFNECEILKINHQLSFK